MGSFRRNFLIFGLACGLATNAAAGEVLIGEPALVGRDFPRILGGSLISEEEYTLYVRSCEVSLDAMDVPIADPSKFSLHLAVKFYLKGAAGVSQTGFSFETYMRAVREKCVNDRELNITEITELLAKEALE